MQRRILLGTYAISSVAIAVLHGRAMAVRQEIAQDFADAFRDVDVLMTPTGTRRFQLSLLQQLSLATAANVAPLLSEAAQLPAACAYASDIMTVPASLAGVPAISVPASLDPISGVQHVGRLSSTTLLTDFAPGLPIGLQLICARGREGALLASS